MAKSSIRKTDPTDTTAPAKRRRTTPAKAEAVPVAKAAAPRRRKTPEAVEAAAAVKGVIDGTNGHDESFEVPHEHIAVRAYHIFLERGGHSGDQFADWVTAERELREQRDRG